MDNSEVRPVRRVRCPRCHSVLEEPGAPVYKCGGCDTTLRAKNRTGSAGGLPAGPTSGSGLPPRSRHLEADGDVASTSRSSPPTPPDVRTSWRQGRAADAASSPRHDVASTSSAPDDAVAGSRRQGSDATSRRESGDLVSARRRGSGDGASTSSTPDATAGSRRQGSDPTSRRESGDLVSARWRGSGDDASTSSTPDATAGSRRQCSDPTGRRESGDPVSVSNRVSEQVSSSIEIAAAAANQEARDDSDEGRRPRDAGGGAGSPVVISAVRFSGGSKEAASSSELQDDSAEKRMKRQAESTDAARKKHSGEAAVQPQYHHRRQEPAPTPPQAAAAAKSARDVLRREDDNAAVAAAAAAAAAAGEKAPSPSRHEVIKPEENLGPLRKKILQTVDELKGDLSQLFSKSPELNNPPRTRPPRLPKQEGGDVSRAAVALARPSSARARHAATAATDGRRGSAPRLARPAAQAAAPLRGLPSRRYRQCRADPCCCHSRSCHRGCCGHHGRPECSSCRGHCCRLRAQEPSAPRKPPAAKGRLPPRNHCRPVLKGAPFIVCSSCFKLVQVPADFAVFTKTVRKLRCGSCSAVLSYSYRDPARKKAYQEDSIIEQSKSSTDGSELQLQGGKGFPHPHPFAPFVDGFGLSSYSTDDEQLLHVSRNTSFDTMDGTKGVGRLHRLMGYGSASELLRHSPDLYESFSERTTPDVTGHYDRKGKSVCIDDDDGYDVDDSDEEDGGALKRSAARGPGWPLPWTLGKGTPAPGAIRIK